MYKVIIFALFFISTYSMATVNMSCNWGASPFSQSKKEMPLGSSGVILDLTLESVSLSMSNSGLSREFLTALEKSILPMVRFQTIVSTYAPALTANIEANCNSAGVCSGVQVFDSVNYKSSLNGGRSVIEATQPTSVSGNAYITLDVYRNLSDISNIVVPAGLLSEFTSSTGSVSASFDIKLTNRGTALPSHPQGSYSRTLYTTVNCSKIPTPLVISATPSIINFGNVNIGKSVDGKFNVSITSGSETPSANIYFSGKTSPYGVLNVGGGLVTIKRDSDNLDMRIGAANPIDARDMSFTATLNSSGGSAGDATESVVITMLLN